MTFTVWAAIGILLLVLTLLAALVYDFVTDEEAYWAGKRSEMKPKVYDQDQDTTWES